MTYNDMPVIIPLLATGYLLTIYLLLMLAQRTIKSSRYVADSLTDAYASYVSIEPAPQRDEFEQWSQNPQRSSIGRWTTQRSSIGRWTNLQLKSSASSSGVAALRQIPKGLYPYLWEMAVPQGEDSNTVVPQKLATIDHDRDVDKADPKSVVPKEVVVSEEATTT